jgi:hydrogenase-1 operon protein HyaF
MSFPFETKPFPIPVVGAGSQPPEEDGLQYLPMPQGMHAYRMPTLPEPEALGGHRGALQALHGAVAQVRAWRRGEPVAPITLDALEPADRALVNQVLGEGEVSAQVLHDDGTPRVVIQESVFAGVWRVLEHRDDGTTRDTLEIGPVPSILLATAQQDGAGPPPAMPPQVPAGVLNAVPLLAELAEHRAQWQPGRPAEVVNLTLLPVGPEDIAYLDHGLGTGRIVILSRGYGNCRITDTRVPHTWRVVYYNSQDTVILNAVEVVGIPEVACAAAEDLADSEERLVEVLQWVESA